MVKKKQTLQIICTSGFEEEQNLRKTKSLLQKDFVFYFFLFI